MKRLLNIAAVLFLTMVVGETGEALPRFQSRTGAKCQSCHVNPSGGGMRQAFGQQYGRETLPVPTWSEEFGLDDFSTKLTEAVSVGADFRTLFFIQQLTDSAGTNTTSNNAFFQMQGDVYLNFKLAKKVNIYLDKGIYSGFEIFGLLNVLPGNGYIKIGKFMPNYGMKVDEHRLFIRTGTGFSAETGRKELTGGEVGFNAGPVNIMGGVFNAADGFGAGTGDKKAILGRVDGIFKLNEEGTVNLGLGANVFTKQAASGMRTTLFGGMGSFSYNNLTILGEVDWMKNKLGGVSTTGIISYVEADYMATPGLDLKFIYEFADPNVDLKTGAISRYSIGLEFFPISGVEVRPLYRFVSRDLKGASIPFDVNLRDYSNDEFNLVVHFYL